MTDYQFPINNHAISKPYLCCLILISSTNINIILLSLFPNDL